MRSLVMEIDPRSIDDHAVSGEVGHAIVGETNLPAYRFAVVPKPEELERVVGPCSRGDRDRPGAKLEKISGRWLALSVFGHHPDKLRVGERALRLPALKPHFIRRDFCRVHVNMVEILRPRRSRPRAVIPLDQVPVDDPLRTPQLRAAHTLSLVDFA